MSTEKDISKALAELAAAQAQLEDAQRTTAHARSQETARRIADWLNAQFPP